MDIAVVCLFLRLVSFCAAESLVLCLCCVSASPLRYHIRRQVGIVGAPAMNACHADLNDD